MKHDGITILLKQPNGERIKEYDNGTDDEPHPDFDGLIGTRQIAVVPGTAVEVVVTLDEGFYLFSADGVWIEIYTGSPTSSLTLDESGQCWWIRNDRRSVAGTYTFSFYTIFAEREFDTRYPFAIPSPDESDYANASHRWVVGDSQPLSTSSLVVYVSRGKWDPKERHHRTKTEPLQMFVDPEPLVPVVIHNQWVRPLNSENGAPYIFEYRNMGADAIDAEREEADEELGHGDDDAIVADGEEEEDDEVESEDEALSSRDDYFDPDELYESNNDFSDDASEYKPESHRGSSRSKKRKRGNSPVIQNSSLDADDEELPNGKSLIFTFKTPYRGRCETCDPDAKNDEEELPRRRTSGLKVEKDAGIQPSRLGPRTLGDLTGGTGKAGLRTRGISQSPLVDRGAVKTQRDASRNASSPLNTAPRNAYTIPLPTPPSERQQRMQASRRDVVDLTAEPEEKPVIIKGETVDAIPLNESSQAAVTTPAADDEDSEDLEDELRQIEIRRKLRAKKKNKKRAAGQTAF